MTYTERARKMRPYIEQAASALDDKTVSLAPELLGTLTGDGSLVNEIIEEGFTALKEDEAK